MISRRLLRIKALLIIYAFNRKSGENLDAAEKELILSIKKTYDLYHFILLLILEIVDIADEKIEIARNKKIPSYKDLNPNTRFIDNKLVKQLRSNNALKKYIKSAKLSWSTIPEFPRKIYNELLLWDKYVKYMESEENSYLADKKFIIRLISEFISVSEDLEPVMEEQSIYWNDDIDFVIVMLEKTLKHFRENTGSGHKLMPLYRSREDEIFVKTLFRKVILKAEENIKLIDINSTNWEIERIALMDMLVMQLAITEIFEFPEIPVKVSLNEYIEIAKYYCTAKSSTFVNGILDKIVQEMRKKDMFRKTGRGLIGEPGFERKKK